MFNLMPFARRNEVASQGDFFNQVFDQFFKDDFFAPFAGTSQGFCADIKETNEGYVIKADLPGINKEDITLSFANNYLTILAKRQEEVESKTDNYLCRERHLGQFSRSFYFPNARGENIDAEFKEGVLTIKLCKRERVLPETKQIPIR